MHVVTFFVVFNIFISFHNAKLSIISKINNFDKCVLIDHFHFKHETRIKEKVIELSLEEITIRSANKFTMLCYNTGTELRCHVIILMKFLVVSDIIVVT